MAFAAPPPASVLGILVMRRRRQHKGRQFLPVVIVVGLPAFLSGESHSAPLSAGVFNAMARRCAPTVDPAILAAVARRESHFDPLVLRNNTRHISITPTSLVAGAEQARAWISHGDSIDLGLMQINSTNLAKLKLTAETALDPCHSLQTAAHVLSVAYAQGSSVADRQAALLIALSRYNTGHALAGLANGYVGQVLAAQNQHDQIISKYQSGAKPSGPSWDVWAVAATAQRDGATWLVGSQTTHDFLVGAGAHSETGELHALSEGPGTAPGL